jgi:hypothetical protein
MATEYLRAELTYCMNRQDFNNGGLERMSDLAIRLAGAKKQALGIALKAEIEHVGVECLEGCLAVTVALSARETTDLETALYAYMSYAYDFAYIPRSVKGEYDTIDKVLQLPRFRKTLSASSSFFNGRWVVDLLPEETETG